MLTNASSHGAIQTALSTAVRFAYDGLQNEVEWRDIETVNFTAGSGGDLVVYQDGTSYLGEGTDTFYADWSATTQAILWDNAPTAAAITLANGVTVGGFERLLLTTGSGNDIVKNTQVAVSDWIDTRGGNDVIALSGVSSAYQSDWVAGGTGTDRVDLDFANDSGYFSLKTYASESDTTPTVLTNASSHGAIQTALSTAVRFAYDGLQNEVEWRDIETVNFTAGSGGDLVVYQDGTSYLGGGGTDTFYADWSATTQAILWDNAPTAAAITLANGVTVGGFERLLLTTGSGNDIVKNTQVAVSDWIDTRGGNDVIALSGVSSAYQSDWVAGGTGTDRLDLDFANDSGYFSLKTYASESDTTPTVLTNASSHGAIQTALSTAVRFAYDGLQNEVEWRDIETVNFTAGSGGDLVVYQDGTSYLGGGGRTPSTPTGRRRRRRSSGTTPRPPRPSPWPTV